jgi:plasmid stabilization system protein ParE
VAGRAFRFHPAAETELSEAAGWYESHQSGLGNEFVAAVRQKVESLLDAPERWPMANGARRAFRGKFPYAIVYRGVAEGAVEIIAVAHLKRRPRYWSAR